MGVIESRQARSYIVQRYRGKGRPRAQGGKGWFALSGERMTLDAAGQQIEEARAEAGGDRRRFRIYRP